LTHNHKQKQQTKTTYPRKASWHNKVLPMPKSDPRPVIAEVNNADAVAHERSDNPSGAAERNISKADVWGIGVTLTASNVVSPNLRYVIRQSPKNMPKSKSFLRLDRSEQNDP